jgi:lysozyme
VETAENMMHPRIAVAVLSLSAAGFAGLLLEEGYSDKAIIPVKGDVATIGFGATGGVKLGDTTTPVKAVQRALKDVAVFEGAIKQCVQVPLSQREYDVYTSMAYNIGAKAFCASTIVRRLNAQDYRGACDAILMWKRFQGFDCSTPGNKRCYGLWQRRVESHTQCMAAQ